MSEHSELVAAVRTEVLLLAAAWVESAFYGEPFLNYPPDFAQMLREKAGEKAETDAAPDFFRPNRTYRAVAAPFAFCCVTHTTWPDGSLRALGRSAWTDRTPLHWIATEFAVEDWTGGAWGGWTDVTEEVAS